MKEWSYKARDLAIAYRIMQSVASQHSGSLGFLEDYQADEYTDIFCFTLSPWANGLIQAFSTLYSPYELPGCDQSDVR
jgi:hypothetical protein